MAVAARSKFVGYAVIGLACLGTSQSHAEVAGQAVNLAPHRAVYDITLDRSRGGSGVSDMTGRMVYELTGNRCIGYTQSMRFVTSMTNQEGTTSLTDLRTSSWEDAAGRTFRFSSSQYKDRRLSESTEGEAKRDPASRKVTVALTKPGKKSVALSSGTMFPVQHSIELVAAARRGDRLMPADLYDGSEKGEKAYATVAYIGKPRKTGDMSGLADVASAKPLEKLVAWPVSISYYDAGGDKQDAAPTYELAFLYYENGVSRRLFIDYGDFSIRGVLKEITFIDPGKCP